MPDSAELKKDLEVLLAKARDQAAAVRRLSDQLEELKRKVDENERSETGR